MASPTSKRAKGKMQRGKYRHVNRMPSFGWEYILQWIHIQTRGNTFSPWVRLLYHLAQRHGINYHATGLHTKALSSYNQQKRVLKSALKFNFTKPLGYMRGMCICRYGELSGDLLSTGGGACCGCELPMPIHCPNSLLEAAAGSAVPWGCCEEPHQLASEPTGISG